MSTIAVVKVAPQLLVGGFFRLPLESSIKNARMSFDYTSLELLVENPNLPEVPPNQPPPVITVTVDQRGIAQFDL